MTASDGVTGSEYEESRGLRERLSGEVEDRIGRLADELLANSLVNSALQGALSAGEKMAQAQASAMDALNLPSASNLDKLSRKVRAISQRLDEIEDGVERLDRRLEGSPATQQAKLIERLERVDARLDELTRDVAALRRELAPSDVIPAAQTRATVPEG